ncbi:MAG TPA: cohesin domain-containing protein [Saprospiraceae bacterium]|nr:cohesin domain-containing protein [Saprospiraceae bacterium]HMQ84562.1 cohesin domain-containing protein [Saprospiraceae bacterium]
MNRVFTSLIFWAFCCIWTIDAQTPTFTITPQTSTAQPNDIVDVNIVVSNFSNILSMQFGVNWDPAVAEFVELTNVNATAVPGLSASVHFSTPGGNVPPGQVGISWFSPSFTTINVANGTTIFTIRLRAINGCTDIFFTDDPLPSIEVLNGSFVDVELNPVNGTLEVGDCGAVMQDPVIVDINNANVQQGQQVCVDVDVTDFENIKNLSFTINYDAAKLQFNSVGGFNLSGLDAGDFGTGTAGRITLNWSNATGVTLNDGTVIFEICFTATGTGSTNLTFSGNPTPMAAQNGNNEAVTVSGQSGTVTIMMVNNSDDFELLIESATVNPGEQFCVAITTLNFTDVVGMAFTVNYDPNQLQFNNLTNLNTNLPQFSIPGSTGTPPALQAGNITVNWFNESLIGINLPDGSTIMEMCFTAIGNGSSSNISFSSNITQIEISDSNQEIIPFNSTPSVIAINVDVNGFYLNIADATVDPGEQFCVPITAQNFSDVVGMAFTVNYNPDLLEFDQLTNLNPGLPLFSVAGSTGTPPVLDDGFITVNWYNEQLTGINLPNGATIMEMCFTALGSGISTEIDFSSDIAAIEISDSNQDIIPFNGNSGTITMTGTFSGFLVSAEDATVPQGEQICVPITAQNFEDIVGMAFTMEYNPSHLQFVSVSSLNASLPNFTVLVNFGTPPPLAAGFVTVNWYNESLNPITLIDGAPLFELCFEALGADGTCSDITFSGDITPIEISDGNQDIVPFNSQSGTVCVGMPSTDFLVTAGNANAAVGDQVCIPVTVDNFTNIVGMAYTINYNPAHLEFVQVTNLNPGLPLFSVAGSFGLPPAITAGNITVNWFDQTLVGVSLPNDAVLFELCFNVIGDPSTCSDITFSSAITPIEISDANQDIVPFNSQSGTVCALADFDGFLLTIQDDVVLPGESFCVPVTALNFEDVVGMAFTIEFDDTQLEFDQIANVTTLIPGFSVAESFGLLGVNGVITLNWFNQSLEGVNLPPGEPIFEICFTAIGDDGDMSDIIFTSSVTPIEISDSNQDIIPFNGEEGTITISSIQPPSVISSNIVDVLCFGEATGSIQVTAGGGTGGPYTYAWSAPGGSNSQINNLEAGNYTVTVTDMGSGLTVTQMFTVDEPNNPILVLADEITVPSCLNGNNGSITITTVGGTPGYVYDWSGPGGGDVPGGLEALDLSAGSYTVTVTDNNGCEESKTFNVGAGVGNGGLAIGFSVTDVTCPDDTDGAIFLTVSGWQDLVVYSWSPNLGQGSSLTNIGAGTYTVTVTDGRNCSQTGSFTVDEPDPIVINSTVTDVACFGENTGSVSLSVSGGNPGQYSYLWSPNPNGSSGPMQSNLSIGSIVVQVVDIENCIETTSFTITGPASALNIDFLQTESINIANDGEVELGISGGTSSYSFEWEGPNDFESDDQNLTGLNDPGMYCVTVTDANNCTTTGCVELRRRLRLDDVEIQEGCFGEASGSIDIDIIGGVMPYTIVWLGATPGSDPTVVSNLDGGTYFVTITDALGESITGEFFVSESPEIITTSILVPVTGSAANTNGSISYMVSGGTPPLNYLWNTGSTSSMLNNIGVGTYCVTVTDGFGCQKDTCFNMFYSSPLGPLDITAVNTTCWNTEDGVLQISVSGGLAPYTFTINHLVTGENFEVVSSNGTITQENLAPGTIAVQVLDMLGQSVPVSTVSIGSPAVIDYQLDVLRHDTELPGCQGIVAITVTGGTPGYSVSWDNGGGTGMTIENVCGDQTYQPTITDANGCVYTEEGFFVNVFSIDVPNEVAIACPDDITGIIDMDIEGGEPNYTIIWLNEDGQEISSEEDINDLPSGTYTVVVTEASGNTLMETVSVESASELAIGVEVLSDYNGYDVSCADSEDGQVRAIASGSQSYDYEWTQNGVLVSTSSVFAEAGPGNYQVMVEDNFGCTTTTQVTLAAPNPVEIKGNVRDLSCFGGKDGEISVAGIGGLPGFNYLYEWDNGVFDNRITSLTGGTYTVSVTDANNCTVDSTFTVNEPEPLMITILTEPATDGCNGSARVEVEGGTEPYFYNWANFDGDAFLINLCPGEYFLQVRDAEGCTSELISKEVEDKRFPCLEERVVITPDGNGTNDEFIIFCVNDYPDNHLEIYNRWGQLVFEADNYDNTWEGTTGSGEPLPEGPYYYVLEYTSPEGTIIQRKGSLTILRDN